MVEKMGGRTVQLTRPEVKRKNRRTEKVSREAAAIAGACKPAREHLSGSSLRSITSLRKSHLTTLSSLSPLPPTTPSLVGALLSCTKGRYVVTCHDLGGFWGVRQKTDNVRGGRVVKVGLTRGEVVREVGVGVVVV